MGAAGIAWVTIRKANPYRRMAKAIKTDNYARNVLERNFVGLGPRKALLTDITYIPFKGHFIYVSPVIDACTKDAIYFGKKSIISGKNSSLNVRLATRIVFQNLKTLDAIEPRQDKRTSLIER